MKKRLVAISLLALVGCGDTFDTVKAYITIKNLSRDRIEVTIEGKKYEGPANQSVDFFQEVLVAENPRGYGSFSTGPSRLDKDTSVSVQIYNPRTQESFSPGFCRAGAKIKTVINFDGRNTWCEAEYGNNEEKGGSQ